MSYKRKSSFVKKFSFVFILLMIFQIIEPTVTYALTSGPSQPEVQSFEPFGTSEMVDLFSGDFTYNIPLFELPGPDGGYPFNLAYHSGIGMDQEATWVGLGWSLNPGAINRSMRGLPDDFDGDKIEKTLNLKPNRTYGVSLGGGLKFANIPLSLSLGLKIYNNTYKGVGYAIDAGVSANFALKSGPGAGLGLNLSMDSQEGSTISPSLSISASRKTKQGKGTLGLNASFSFNSNRGLSDVSLGLSYSQSVVRDQTNTDMKEGTTAKEAEEAEDFMSEANPSGGASSSISFAASSYSPTIGIPMKGKSISLSIQLGGNISLGNISGNVSGFYTDQLIKEPFSKSPAFGYLNLENTKNEKFALMDVNREKDGALAISSPNLGIPSLTYDYYNVQGQGVGGMYRPYRNDIGVAFDQYTESNFGGGSLGFEFGFPAMPHPLPTSSTHVAGSASLNFSNSKSHKWEDGNDINSQYDYKGEANAGSLHENVYFKRPGETVSQDVSVIQDKVGGFDPLRIKLTSTTEASATFVNSTNQSVHVDNNDETIAKEYRTPKNYAILPLKNKELGALGEFAKATYYNSLSDLQSNTKTFRNPTNRKGHHIGGITAVNQNGSRYIYGIPAYNNESTESSFSVPYPGDGHCAPTISTNGASSSSEFYKVENTDEYLSKVKTPEYAHSYLLTSILGADFVDITNNGPTDDDFGYWVKFEYVKAENNYEWRAPYTGFNYMAGNLGMPNDDKGSYLYGKKEIWHLAKAETKSHIAVFDISARKDGHGANGEFADSGQGSTNYYKLNYISLYAKAAYKKALLENTEPTLIKGVGFEYNYSLCQGVENNDGSQSLDDNETLNEGGKLTLKKVWFDYGTSNRGQLNPYAFNYKSGAIGNPSYEPRAVDRWGNYKPIVGGDACANADYPYVDQNDSQNDEYTSAWHLEEVVLPSGSKIKVEYEADDYAFVQEKRVTHMFDIVQVGAGNFSETNGSALSIEHDGTPDYSSITNNDRVYFKLKDPVDITLPAHELNNIANEYIKGIDKLYYKIKMKIRNDDGIKDFITGYVDIQGAGIATGSADYFNAEGKATIGYIQFDYPSDYHPFTYSGLQFLRNRYPTPYSSLSGTFDASIDNNADEESSIMSLLGIIDGMSDLFSNYNNIRINADDGGFAQEIEAGKSWIKLNAPDLHKYGGGVRVNKISINDEWDQFSSVVNSDSEYGQVYNYTTNQEYLCDDPATTEKEYCNREISSGVATYEPIIGGDENPLKTGVYFTEKMKMRDDVMHMFETPVNESYYPGASVGYSKITVSSLNTDNVLKNGNPAPGDNYGFSASGVSVNEFYTAHDFPLIAKQTDLGVDKDNKTKFHTHIPVMALLVNINIEKMAASQGYSLELNDMHGKPKKMSKYGIDKNGDRISDPYSWTEYKYFNDEYIEAGEKFYRLNNEVPVILSDKDPNDLTKAETETRMIGVDYEMFTDMRHSHTESSMGGANVNVEIFQPPPPPFVIITPIVIPLPNVGYTWQETNVAVTNKIINRVGILKETVSYRDGVTSKSENLLFDSQTGAPLLTRYNNNYDNPVYDYKIPARWKYDKMGAAYKNLGLKIEGTVSTTLKTAAISKSIAGTEHLVEGDELIVFEKVQLGQTPTIIPFKAYVIGETNSAITLAGEEPYSFSNVPEYSMMVIRSGRRNQLDVNVAEVVALADPTKNREVELCEHDFNSTTGGTTSGTAFNFNNLTYAEQQSLLSVLLSPPLGTEIASVLDAYDYGTEYNIAASYNVPFDHFRVVNYPYPPNIPSCNVTDDMPFIEFYDSANEKFLSVIQTYKYGAPFNCTPQWNVFGTIAYPPLTNPLLSSVLSNGNTTNSNVIVHDPAHTQYFVSGNYSFSPMIDYIDYSFLRTDWVLKASNSTFGANSKGVIYVYSSSTGIPSDGVSISNSIVDTLYNIDSVLNVSVSTFKSHMDKDFNELKGSNYNQAVVDGLKEKNPYANGSAGIWRMDKSFAYLKEREGINKGVNRRTDTNISAEATKSESDGMFDMIMYKWDGSSLANDCEPAWIKVSEVTRYNSYGEAVEEKDVLNNYSSALFGYGGKLSVAVASNAQEDEIGFESFEELPSGNFDQFESSAGNIDIYKTYSGNSDIYEEYNISHWGVNLFGGSNLMNSEIIVEESLDGCFPTTTTAIIEVEEWSSCFDEDGDGAVNISTECYNNYPGIFPLIGHAVSTSGFTGVFEVSVSQTTSSSLVPLASYSNPSEYDVLDVNYNTPIALNHIAWPYLWNNHTIGSPNPVLSFFYKGKLLVPTGSPVVDHPHMQIDDYVAHTGMKSMKITGVNQEFTQTRLQLNGGSRYNVSLWVNVPSQNNDVGSYSELSVPPNVTFNRRNIIGNGLIQNIDLVPVGNIINGWQKMEGIIEVGTCPELISFSFDAANSSVPTYFDDLRVHPVDAGIKTFVYDPISLKLQATLDNNNFATLYYYSEDGSLFLVKKETARGIKTIQESRAFTKENGY